MKTTMSKENKKFKKNKKVTTTQETTPPKLAQSKKTYTHKIVCFVDILGFKDFIEKNDHKKTNDLYEVLKKLNPSGIRSLLTEYFSKIEPNEYLSLSINQFSDSFVISCDTNDTFSVKMLIRTLITLEYILLGKLGLMMRGAVCLGNLVHDDNGVMFGPAMVEAYHLESNIAKHPRIIITDDAYNLIRGCVPDARTFTYTDIDNYKSMDAISILKLSLIELIRAKNFMNFNLLHYASSKSITAIQKYADSLNTEKLDAKVIESIRSKSKYIKDRFEEFKLQIDDSISDTGIKFIHDGKLARLSINDPIKYEKFLDSHFAFTRQFQGKINLAY